MATMTYHQGNTLMDIGPHPGVRVRSSKLYFCSTGAPSETVRGIVMLCATCDPMHLLYFVTPVLGWIQVIGRNAS